MCVVVQRMVDARAAGVLFTADPVSHRRAHLVIDAVEGLGEALVSGAATPEELLAANPDTFVRFVPDADWNGTVIDGITSQGVDVDDLGMITTDMVYYAAGAMDQPGAMITASHNPARYNGLKFSLREARPVSGDHGIPLLEDKADERWGGQDDYEAYKRSTPVLMMKPPATQS